MIMFLFKDSTTLTICSIGVYAAGETTPVIWPHPSNLVIVQSEVGKTCSDTCSNSKMVSRNVNTITII